MWSLYHESGGIFVPLSLQAAKLQRCSSFLRLICPHEWGWEGYRALKNCSGMPYKIVEAPEDGSCRLLKTSFSVASDEHPKSCHVQRLAHRFHLKHVMIFRNQTFHRQTYTHTHTHTLSHTQKKNKNPWSHSTHLLLHQSENCLQRLEQRSYPISFR